MVATVVVARSPEILRAERHVAEARRAVERQRSTIARIKACNGYADREVKLLATFEQSLAIFETDLTAITAALASQTV